VDGKIKYGVSFLAIIALMIFVWLNSRIPGNLEALSPMEAADLYYKASYNGNAELLAKLIYFPPGTTEQQKQKRINSSNSDNSPEVRAILSMVGFKSFATYERQ
jgi:hypothetical protein